MGIRRDLMKHIGYVYSVFCRFCGSPKKHKILEYKNAQLKQCCDCNQINGVEIHYEAR